MQARGKEIPQSYGFWAPDNCLGCIATTGLQ